MTDSVFLDPDYRRAPKTEYFCGVCQRDIKRPGAPQFWLEDCCAIRPDVRHDNAMLVHVGPECAKKIPAEWLLYQKQESA